MILGYAGAISRDPTGTDITFPVTSLIAIMEGPAIASVIGEGSGRDANDLRALANLAGMLDHVRSVQSSE